MRRSASLLVALVAPAVAGCHAPPLEGVGRSTFTPGTSGSAAASADSGPLPSPVPADVATRLARVGPESFVSWGHAGGRFTATVYLTPESQDALRGGRAGFASGTVIAMATVERASKKPGPTYFMEKGTLAGGATAGAWRFGVTPAPTATAEELGLCARCHAEAQNDHVFGLPEP